MKTAIWRSRDIAAGCLLVSMVLVACRSTAVSEGDPDASPESRADASVPDIPPATGALAERCEALLRAWQEIRPASFQPRLLLRTSATEYLVSDLEETYALPPGEYQYRLYPHSDFVGYEVNPTDGDTGTCLLSLTRDIVIAAGPANGYDTVFPIPSPDNRFFLWDTDDGVWTADAETGEVRQIWSGANSGGYWAQVDSLVFIVSGHYSEGPSHVAEADMSLGLVDIDAMPPELLSRSPRLRFDFPRVPTGSSDFEWEVSLLDRLTGETNLIASAFDFRFLTWGNDTRVYLQTWNNQPPAFIEPENSTQLTHVDYPEAVGQTTGYKPVSPDGYHMAYFGIGNGHRGWVIDGVVVGPSGLAAGSSDVGRFSLTSSHFTIHNPSSGRLDAMRIDGSEHETRASGVTFFEWAPDDSRLLFQDTSGIFIASPDLSEIAAPAALNPGEAPLSIRHAQWSSDGESLYLLADGFAGSMPFRYSIADDTLEALADEAVFALEELR